MSDTSKKKSSKRKQNMTPRSLNSEMKIRKSDKNFLDSSSAKTRAIIDPQPQLKNSTFPVLAANSKPKPGTSAMVTVQQTIQQFFNRSEEISECPRRNIESIPLTESNDEVENEDESILTDVSNSDEDEVFSTEPGGAEDEVSLVKRPTFNAPTWLQKYFKYDGHLQESKNRRDTIQMTCELCLNDPVSKSKTGIFRGTPFYNFKRHVKKVHPTEYAKEDPKLTGGTNEKSNVGATDVKNFFESTDWIKPDNKHAYKMTHPVQSRFVKDMMDCVAIDQLPLDLIERPTFVKMIRNLNKNIRIFSRRTIGRRMKRFYEYEFLQKVRKTIQELDPQNLHVILDMWTDREKNALMGIKAQFVSKNWKLQNLVLGFRYFNTHHDSIAIRNIFDNVLKKTFKVDTDKVGFAIGDNASNMKAAFDGMELTYTAGTSLQNEHDIYADDGDEEWEDFEDFFDIDENNDVVADDSKERECFQAAEVGLDKWANLSVPKHPCYCHLLQLTIKDAIESNENVSALIKDIKRVKKFFHASSYWYQKFKLKAGKGLVNQGETRWNTICFVLERLIQPQVQLALDEILAETRGTQNPCKIAFSKGDYAKMEQMSKLLAPILELTNCLQADRVTSSLVIPGLSGAYKAIESVDVGEIDDAKRFQESLLKCIRERFSCGFLPENSNEKSRRSRITTDEVYLNQNLVLASWLDPRIKGAPFEDTSDALNFGHTTALTALRILEKRFEQQKQRNVGKEIPVNSESSTKNTPKRSSLFQHLDKVKSTMQSMNSCTRGEIQRYLDLPYENEGSDPLEFWRNQMGNFPILAQLARIYLGFPASSGSAERLFSIAGALQRSRRSRLKWSTIELMLCYREMRLKEIFGQKGENFM